MRPLLILMSVFNYKINGRGPRTKESSQARRPLAAAWENDAKSLKVVRVWWWRCNGSIFLCWCCRDGHPVNVVNTFSTPNVVNTWSALLLMQMRLGLCPILKKKRYKDTITILVSCAQQMKFHTIYCEHYLVTVGTIRISSHRPAYKAQKVLLLFCWNSKGLWEVENYNKSATILQPILKRTLHLILMNLKVPNSVKNQGCYSFRFLRWCSASTVFRWCSYGW